MKELYLKWLKRWVARNDVFFRAGVGACIYNHEKGFLVFERRLNHDCFQFPQGGRDVGENVTSTLWRELREETGLVREDFISYQRMPQLLSYEYGNNHRKLDWIGQTHQWYFLELREHIDIDLESVEDKEFVSLKWITQEEILEQLVDFRKDNYKQLFQHFNAHIKK